MLTAAALAANAAEMKTRSFISNNESAFDTVIMIELIVVDTYAEIWMGGVWFSVE